MNFFQKFSKQVLTALFLILTIGASAYHTVNYNAVNGIASNAVRKIFIDNTHRIWLGTDNGISLMTGNGITNYVYSNGLTHNKIWEIAQCRDSSMWFGSFGKGLYGFTKERFINYPLPGTIIHNSIRKLHPFKDLLFVGTEVGLRVFDYKSKQYVPFFNKSEPDSFQILDFFEYKGTLYFQSFYFGTFKINYQERTYENVRFNLVENKWNYSAYQHKDTLYLARTHFIDTEDDNLLYCKTEDYLKGLPLKSIKLKSIIWEFAHTSEVDLFAACWGVRDDSGGLYKRKGNRMELVNKEMGIGSNQLWTICFDQSTKKMYVGSTDKGLYVVDNNEIVRKEPYSVNENVLDLKVKGSNTYVLTNDFLKHIQNGKEVRRITKLNISKLLSNVKPICMLYGNYLQSPLTLRQLSMSEKNVVLTSNKGIFRFDTSLNFIDFIFTGYDCIACFLKNDDVLVYGNYSHSVLVESFGKGSITYFPRTQSSQYPVGAEQNIHINDSICLLSNSGGRLYMFHQMGRRYNRIDTLGSIYLPGFLDQVSENNLVLVDMSNVIYRGHYQSDSLKMTKMLDLKVHGVRECYFIKSLSGLFIVSTNIGMVILDGKKTYLVDKSDGLPDNLNYRNAQYQNGLILLSSSEGIYSIDISQLRLLKVDYELSHLEVRTDTDIKSFKAGQKVTLKKKQNAITILFELNNHPYPEKIQYSYRLNDDITWKKLEVTGKIQLSNPDYGSTTVYVKLYDRLQGNEVIIELLSVHLSKPIYLQGWFQSLMIILIATLIFIFIYRFRVKQLKRKAENAIRETQIVQLELDTLQFLLKPHFIFNALTSIQNLIIKGENEKSLDYSSYFAKLLRGIMQNTGNELIVLSEELRNIESYIELEKLRFNDQIAVVVNLSEDIDAANTPVIPFLFQPLVENIFKHAFKENHSSPSIEISIYPKDQYLVYQISDNGVGLQGYTLDQMLKKQTSKGLKIIQAQLEKFYKSNFKLSLLENPHGGVSWYISIPI